MHSGLDLVAAAITYISVRVSDKPADTEHPFGHGKIEHLSAFIETGLLDRHLCLDRLGSCAAGCFSAKCTWSLPSGPSA